MTQAIDLIKGALRRVNAYQSGEAIAPLDAQDCLDTLNDLLDSLSTDHCSIVGSTENVFQWIPGQSQYKIGNPLCTDLGLPTFAGTCEQNVALIGSISVVPPQLVVGASITDSANVFPAGTTVNGQVGFQLNTGTAPTSACTITFSPAAPDGWNCVVHNASSNSTLVLATGIPTTTTAVITNFSAIGTTASFSASNTLLGTCTPY